MSYSGGLSINYTAANVEDVILDKLNIDSNKDVLAGAYAIELMQEIKTDLTAIIATLQTQVNDQAAEILLLEQHIINTSSIE